MKEEKFLTPEEVSRMLRISVQTLSKWRKAGKIPYTQVSRSVRFKEQDVLTLIRKSTKHA